MSDPDPAAIMAQHERHWQSHGSPICLGGREYAEDPELPDVSRCLIYQLAEALAEAQERERRVRA